MVAWVGGVTIIFLYLSSCLTSATEGVCVGFAETWRSRFLVGRWFLFNCRLINVALSRCAPCLQHSALQHVQSRCQEAGGGVGRFLTLDRISVGIGPVPVDYPTVRWSTKCIKIR